MATYNGRFAEDDAAAKLRRERADAYGMERNRLVDSFTDRYSTALTDEEYDKVYEEEQAARRALWVRYFPGE